MRPDSSDIAALVTAAWGLEDPHAEPAGRGMNSRTWLVEAGNARFIAKLVPADQHDRFVSGLAVSRVVEALGLPTGAPIATSDGSLWTRIADSTLALLTFVDGGPLVGDEPGEQRLIGRTLGRAHRILIGRAVPGGQGRITASGSQDTWDLGSLACAHELPPRRHGELARTPLGLFL